MARPIEATPVLTGRDAEIFLRQVRLTEPVSKARLAWLERLAEESKSAENVTRPLNVNAGQAG
jgi:hypothetical protein